MTANLQQTMNAKSTELITQKCKNLLKIQKALQLKNPNPNQHTELANPNRTSSEFLQCSRINAIKNKFTTELYKKKTFIISE